MPTHENENDNMDGAYNRWCQQKQQPTTSRVANSKQTATWRGEVDSQKKNYCQTPQCCSNYPCCQLSRYQTNCWKLVGGSDTHTKPTLNRHTFTSSWSTSSLHTQQARGPRHTHTHTYTTPNPHAPKRTVWGLMKETNGTGHQEAEVGKESTPPPRAAWHQRW